MMLRETLIMGEMLKYRQPSKRLQGQVGAMRRWKYVCRVVISWLWWWYENVVRDIVNWQFCLYCVGKGEGSISIMVSLHADKDYKYIEKGQCKGQAHGLIWPTRLWSWHISSYVSTWRACGVLVQGQIGVYATQYLIPFTRSDVNFILGLPDRGRQLHMKSMLDWIVWSRLFPDWDEDVGRKLLGKKIEDLAPFTTRDMVLDIVRCAMVNILCIFLLARGNQQVEDRLWGKVAHLERDFDNTIGQK